MGSTFSKRLQSLIESLPFFQTLHITMVGLDSAGKTTALYRLKFGQYINTLPTIGFNCEKIKFDFRKSKKLHYFQGVSFTIWDIGGQDKLRPLWIPYTRCTDGIIFMVDSVDDDRFEEARIELMRTLKFPQNAQVPVLIFANKHDLPNSKTPDEITQALGLNDLNGKHLWHIQSCCSITGDDLEDGLEHLYEMILERRRMQKLQPNNQFHNLHSNHNHGKRKR
ncbi:ADP-ribosylation factor-like protein 4C [Dermatophagoides pteronyssinus]|uniref:ADP-ribosylation factor-like protein 4C n=1 Tax=Dermatophagoides pteronyssinus TaxID=6956 RepID=UPI003F67563C